jgi:ribosome-binding ATPase YchF (GTP1/OBG family)
VVHDELDLPPGTVKLKKGGGTGGHNGLTDIVEALDTKDFWRLRIGIGHPGHKDLVADYVLHKASGEEQALIDPAFERSLDVMPWIAKGRMTDAMTWLHTKAVVPAEAGTQPKTQEKEKSNGTPMRHRRPAQRGQIDALQRAHESGHRGGELSLLHHRAERRRGGDARCAPGQAREDRQAEKVLPAIVEFVDIAGLVAGASKGEGLGNQFLANIRETNAIANVVRCFKDDNVIHVSGKVDPHLGHRGDPHRARARGHVDGRKGGRALQQGGAIRRQGSGQDGRAAREGREIPRRLPSRARHGAFADELAMLQQLQLLTAKPALYIANVDEKGFENNPLLDRVKEYAAKEGAPVVAICAKIEAEIADLAGDEKQLFLADMGLEEPGLNRLIRADLRSARPADVLHRGPEGSARVDREKGATAPQAAGVIHTDSRKGFIRAEVIAYDDYVNLSGEQAAKEAGKMRLEGKDYVVKDGDVMHFRFNV